MAPTRSGPFLYRASSCSACSVLAGAPGRRYRVIAQLLARPARLLPPRLVGLLPIGLPALARADAVDRRRSRQLRRGCAVEHHQRLAAVAGLLDGAAQNTAIRADRLVRLPEMLLGRRPTGRAR